ncbi:probable arginine--tRNA ligase, mitochondrial [Drosophila sulfurigaster albostrigata]|uniref:probable arginine--tRNA ligase, mitochondrial n=1 Tax=Drosophila sulfurigaster albostrigata TaxID=89887 RepID=UPI002D21A6C7|nr:probable arginine--tRNA ligase, mitochondrial [Drosophila sulfurigaster albostrigata]
MTSRIRRAICEQLPQLENIYHALEVPAKKLSPTSRPLLQWTLPATVAQHENELLESVKSQQFDATYLEQVRVVPSAGRSAAKVEFQLQPDAFATHLLQAGEATTVSPSYADKHVVIEFSSPNIAKPFHVGHLRSTIIGNVLANLYQHLGYRTTRLNYLGDWGTQFGLLALGVQLKQVSDAEMRTAPIETLYNAYVVANKAATENPALAQRARELFSALEAGTDDAMTAQWQQYRHYTIDELTAVYERLGVQFDSYEWESQYSQSEITEVLTKLRSAGMLQGEHDGREVVVVGQRRVPVIKSDGSTLYLARDIAALLKRQRQLQFSRMLYVVDNGQADHFNALFQTVTALDNSLNNKLQHVKFGRIHGMSTRQGKAIFLRDVLDEAREVMREKRSNSATTKKNRSMNDELVCDVLGVSAVLVNVLKQRRQRDHEFSWDQALQVNGDTGIKLQYTHCRLHSLLDNFKHIQLADIKPSWQHLTQEPSDALDVLYELARFEQFVWQSKEQLEACVLVNYLFGLCNATSRALKRLPVKQERCLEKQSQRLLLFHAAKRTLHRGMQLLGLKPLNQM